MDKNYKVIVIGCGGLGSAALYWLSRELGSRLLGLEQFRLGHERGTSQDHSAQYGLACAARALDSAVYLASANQLGDYPEASFDTPGSVYGPHDLRVCTHMGTRSVAGVDLRLPECWRNSFGSTLPGHARTSVPQSLL
jgi:glycine/D-amino acid oxidase-like deaminating enzyme